MNETTNDARLWVSDDGLYLARSIPGESTWRDVIEISTGKVWLGSGRVRPTSFDDPRCGKPAHRRLVTYWGNRGRHNARRGPHRYERWIEAWELVFGDIDIEHSDQFWMPYLDRREATFRRRVPTRHLRRHAQAEALVTAALAADPPWSAVGLGGPR